MRDEKTKEEVISFWDHHFHNLEAMAKAKSDIVLDTSLDECLQILGDSCEEVLDIACGNGLALIETRLIGGKIKRGLGFDSSKNAIEYANKIVAVSKIDNLRFEVGDESFLAQINDASYDGIFCSNFLDVIPEEISLMVMGEIKRILKPQGLLLLKFNFFLTDDLIARLKMEKVGESCYAMNGVFRANNKTTEQWLGLFNEFEVVKQTGYQRAPGLPEDRLILLKKLNNLILSIS
jgi:ubiquinone/menaquinone biosynthesis C-methylase UbiE